MATAAPGRGSTRRSARSERPGTCEGVGPTGPQGSHVLSSMLTADALAIVPSAVTDVPDGARVQIEPLRELGGMLS